MAHDSLDPTKGFPIYVGTGVPADAADLSELGAMFGSWIDRVVATQAALSTAFTYLYAGLSTRVTAIPGAYFQYNGTTWDMVGTARFASATARDGAITSPAAGWSVYRTDLQVVEIYNGSAWIDQLGKPEWGLQLSSALGTTNGSGQIITWDAVANDLGNTLNGAFTVNRATGVLTCARAGTYDFNLDVQFATSTAGSRTCYYGKALAATPSTFTLTGFNTGGTVPSGGFPSEITGHWVVPMAVGDNIEFAGLQSSGGALNITAAHLFVKQLL